MKIILCIDDSFDRYTKFSWMCREKGYIPVVGYGKAFIDFYLENLRSQIAGICLDHDMPGYNGQEVARNHLVERSIPIVITSANPEGAQKISEIFTEYEVTHTKMKPVNALEWQRRALEWFEDQT